VHAKSVLSTLLLAMSVTGCTVTPGTADDPAGARSMAELTAAIDELQQLIDEDAARIAALEDVTGYTSVGEWREVTVVVPMAVGAIEDSFRQLEVDPKVCPGVRDATDTEDGVIADIVDAGFTTGGNLLRVDKHAPWFLDTPARVGWSWAFKNDNPSFDSTAAGYYRCGYRPCPRTEEGCRPPTP